MTTNQIQINKNEQNMAAIEQAITTGNLNALNAEQRLSYYKWVCDEAGLSMASRPFDFLVLNNKTVLYAKKDATDQLRKIHGVSITKVEKEVLDGMCVVTAYARDKHGKEDCDMGAVPVANLKGDMYANAILKCITKAKRRVTLSICGMGLLDESELDTVSGAIPQPIDMAEKSAIQAKRLKERAAPVLPAPVAPPAPVPVAPIATDTPPPAPAVAKKKVIEPEVLPKSPMPAAPVSIGDTIVPNGCPHAKKKFSDLERSELTDIAGWIVNGETVEKWTGPKFIGFKAQFEAYVSQFQDIGDAIMTAVNSPMDMDEPSEIPPPPPPAAKKQQQTQMVAAPEDEEDPGAFFEKPNDDDFVTIAINRLKFANTPDELAAARKQFQLDCKDPKKINLAGLPPTEAKKIMGNAASERDKADARIKALK